MAIVPMKRVLVAARRSDRKPILELLQRAGIVEIHGSDLQDDVFGRQDQSSARASFEKNAAMAQEAMEALARHAPENKGLLSSLEGRRTLPLSGYEERVGRRDEIMQLCRRILSLDREFAQKQEQLPKLESRLAALEPWLSYDLPLDFTGTKKAAVFTGSIAGEVTLEQAEAMLEEYAPEVTGREVHLISASPEQTCLFLVCGRRDAPRLQEALRAMNFARPPLTSVNPAQAGEEIRREIEALRAQIAELDAQIAELAGQREDLAFAQDYFTMRADKYSVIGELAQSRRVFLLEGYVPAAECGALEQRLTARFSLVFEAEDPGEAEEVPVLLENGAFAAPVESVVESYALPARGEMDPTTLVACFYYILFGLMLSDAAYGLIMVIACGLCLYKFRNMESGMKKSMQMFLYCGISTTVCGFLFGSFFGDAVNVIASTFFHRPDISLPAIWFEPIDKPMQMLVFCFVVAIIHLFVGLGAKFYMCVKAGQLLDGIYDAVFWYLLVGGAVGYLLTVPMFTEMLGLGFTLPALAGQICAVLAGAGTLGILLTSGRESKNWGKRLLKGLYGVYGVTGYLSDILSYSRLLALGLATSVISSVFNKMGSMVGDGVFGAIVFILVFVVGHSLNLAINALGAYVHTNRLTFVEFFGKFYEGGGRKFEPFAVRTKYFKIKEEN
ncbi:MAG: V-type ATP synthase subunit I [Eubacteriales bacterium]|nr:V-type ATP synthase subunit I [Eubacteriales bacterium]